MKKTTIILLLVIQIVLLFIFQNIQSLFKEIEEVDITKIKNPNKFTEDIRQIRKIFSTLAIAMGLLVIGYLLSVVELMYGRIKYAGFQEAVSLGESLLINLGS